MENWSLKWVEPGALRPGAVVELAHAKSLVEQGDFGSAIPLFEFALKADLPADLHGEVATNLAAALCMVAQSGALPQDAALAQLDRARVLLSEAMLQYDPLGKPIGWASARTNLALVYLARHRLTESHNDLLQAHLALDGTEEALHRASDVEMRGWVKAVRDHLLDLRDRRSSRR